MLAVVGAIVAVAVNGIGSGAVGNGGGRIGSTSSNFRFTWWSQAWHGFTHHVLAGTGAGTFHLLNLRYRKTYLDYTIEPHNLPVQILAELGLVGLVLLVLACVVLLRGSLRRSGHELALALLLPAFLVHSLVDVDWDFVAVAAPAFVAAGALVGRPAERRRLRGFSLLPAFGVALVCSARSSPWLARRWVNEATRTPRLPGAPLANRAHSLDPFLVEPYWAKAMPPTPAAKREAYAQYSGRRQAAEESANVASRRRVRDDCRLSVPGVAGTWSATRSSIRSRTGRAATSTTRCSSSSTRTSTRADCLASAEHDDELGAVERARRDAVERTDDVHVQVVREPAAFGLPAPAVHDDRRRVVLAASRSPCPARGSRCPRASPLRPTQRRFAHCRSGRRRRCATEDASPERTFVRLAHNRVRLLHRCRGSKRGRFGVPLHGVRERLCEQEQRGADAVARARSRRQGSRRASRSAKGG